MRVNKAMTQQPMRYNIELDLTAEERARLKAIAALAQMTVKQYVTELIRQQLAQTQKHGD